MRRKLTLVFIFALAISSALSATFVIVQLRRESYRVIDRQLGSIASLIFASKFSPDLLKNFDVADDLVMEKLGEERVDAIVRIFSAADRRVLYENQQAQILELPPPETTGIHTHLVEGRRMRILEISDARYYLQLALAMDPVLSRTHLLERRSLEWLLAILVIVTAVSAVALRILMRPFRRMSADLRNVAEQVEGGPGQLRETARVLAEYGAHAPKSGSGRDEVDELWTSLAHFSSRVSNALTSWEKQFAQLMHEIKTPLTVIRNELQTRKVDDLLPEVDRLSQMAKDFLHWSFVANQGGTPPIHALPIPTSIKEVIDKLPRDMSSRIQFRADGEAARAFAYREHFDQMIRNVLENALRHTSGPIDVVCAGATVSVFDTGRGLPEEVLAKRGHPFNRGRDSAGTGLGVAWIHALAARYRWKVDFGFEGERHRVRIDF